MKFDTCSRVTVVDNDMAKGGETCVSVFRSGQVTIDRNVFRDNRYPAVFILQYTSHFSVSDNRIMKCRTYGVMVNDFTSHGSVSNNVITGMLRLPQGPLDFNAYGITLQSNIQHVNVIGNTVRGGNTGIYLAIDVQYSTVSSNTVSGCRKGDPTIQVAGIYLDTDCHYNTLSGNTTQDTDQIGIIAHTTCHFNSIVGNTVTGWTVQAGQGVGISVDSGSIGNTVMGNHCDQMAATPGTIGIHLENAPKCRVVGNIVRKCARSIVLSGTTDTTVVALNTVLDNTNNHIVSVGRVEGLELNVVS
jgi:parallel beta-helix repeat protein